jgi:hypothetical protein
MKKILAYAITIAPFALVWLHWGGFRNDFGTLILSLMAVFACTVVSDKMNERSAKAEEEEK